MYRFPNAAAEPCTETVRITPTIARRFPGQGDSAKPKNCWPWEATVHITAQLGRRHARFGAKKCLTAPRAPDWKPESEGIPMTADL